MVEQIRRLAHKFVGISGDGSQSDLDAFLADLLCNPSWTRFDEPTSVAAAVTPAQAVAHYLLELREKVQGACLEQCVVAKTMSRALVTHGACGLRQHQQRVAIAIGVYLDDLQ